MAHALKTEPAANRLKIQVVGLGQCLGQIHVIAATQINRGVLGDDPLLQGGQRDRNLNGGARLSPAR